MPIDITTLCVASFAAFVLFILIMRIRRRLKARAETRAPDPAFDLAELQAMLVANKITREEHDRLREVVLKQRTNEPNLSSPAHGRGFEVRPLKPPRQTPGSDGN